MVDRAFGGEHATLSMTTCASSALPSPPNTTRTPRDRVRHLRKACPPGSRWVRARRARPTISSPSPNWGGHRSEGAQVRSKVEGLVQRGRRTADPKSAGRWVVARSQARPRRQSDSHHRLRTLLPGAAGEEVIAVVSHFPGSIHRPAGYSRPRPPPGSRRERPWCWRGDRPRSWRFHRPADCP